MSEMSEARVELAGLEQTPPLVELKSITKSYPGVLALDAVDLTLYPGEIHALTGENGSGKSTLAKIVYGASQADSGRIVVDGRPVTFRSPTGARALGIIAISQELTLAPTLTVTENVLMGRLPKARSGRIDWKLARQQARDVLERLDIGVAESAIAGKLSIELQQEVEIARAISARARLLVLDEATSSLSERATQRLLQTLVELRSAGVSVLMISHRLSELYAVATRATVLRDGRRTATVELAETPERELVRLMVGRKLEDLYGRRSRNRGADALEVENLQTIDSGLRSTSFTVREGEILGVAGLVGSGKAELGLALAGAIPSVGTVRVGGQRISVASPRRAISGGIGFVSDDRKRSGLLPTRSVQHNLSVAWGRQVRRYGLIDARRENQLARTAIKRFNIVTRSPHTRITTLSGGNQQKTILGRWMMRGCKVLVLGEPTRGIDVGAKSEVYQLIQQVAARGTAVLMISSELPELLGIADRIVVMFGGEICGEFEAAEASEESITEVALTGAQTGTDRA